MNLTKKKNLAAKVFSVGRSRIVFLKSRLNEIKEAITKQDIRDLFSNGAIAVRDIKGRKAVKRRVSRRRMGSVRKKVKNGKRKYVMRTRRLRRYLGELLKQNKISRELYHTLRKSIKASVFRDKTHIKEHIAQIK